MKKNIDRKLTLKLETIGTLALESVVGGRMEDPIVPKRPEEEETIKGPGKLEPKFEKPVPGKVFP